MYRPLVETASPSRVLQQWRTLDSVRIVVFVSADVLLVGVVRGVPGDARIRGGGVDLAVAAGVDVSALADAYAEWLRERNMIWPLVGCLQLVDPEPRCCLAPAMCT